ncbi:MAG: Crp/Fnr family transcriptional regulator [Ferruginibacter sp.]
MEELMALVNSIYPISRELRDHLLRTVKAKTVYKKEFLLKAGKVSHSLCFIQKGLMRAYYLKGVTEVSSWFMTDGDFIVSIESFYEQKESYESIQALEDTEIFYIDFDELEYIYRHYLEFNYIGRVITIKYLTLWAKQLFSIRNQTAEERYLWLLANRPEVILRVPAKYIASYLDITEVTLSRIKNNIAKKRA